MRPRLFYTKNTLLILLVAFSGFFNLINNIFGNLPCFSKNEGLLANCSEWSGMQIVLVSYGLFSISAILFSILVLNYFLKNIGNKGFVIILIVTLSVPLLLVFRLLVNLYIIRIL